MKRAFGLAFSLAFGVFLFLVVLSVIGWREILDILFSLSLFQIFVILLVSLGSVFVGIWRWQQILKNQGNTIPLHSLWESYLGGFSLSFLAPLIIFGGELFRVSALTLKHKVSFSQGFASVVIERILDLTTHSFIVLIGILFFLFQYHIGISRIIGAVLLVTIPLGILLTLFYFKSFRRESILKSILGGERDHAFMEIEKEIFQFFRWENSFFWMGIFLTFLRVSLGLLRVWLFTFLLGEKLGFFSALGVLGFYYAALFIPIPAILGIHDALQAFVFGVLGLGAPTGAAFALILRIADLLIALLGLFFVGRLGMDILKDTFTKSIGKAVS